MVEVRVQESFQTYERNTGIMSDKLCEELEETGMRGKGWERSDSGTFGNSIWICGQSWGMKVTTEGDACESWMSACCSWDCFVLLCLMRCKQLWKLDVWHENARPAHSQFLYFCYQNSLHTSRLVGVFFIVFLLAWEGCGGFFCLSAFFVLFSVFLKLI